MSVQTRLLFPQSLRNSLFKRLEDDFIGPPPVGEHEDLGHSGVRHVKYFLTGPARFSVSKINQLVSLFVTILWVPLIGLVLGPFKREVPVDWFNVIVLTLAGIACGLMVAIGRRDETDFSFVMSQRQSKIVLPKSGR